MLSHRPESSRKVSEWTWTKIGDSVMEVRERAGAVAEQPVLSVTKHRGVVLASEYFKKPVHGKNLANYKLVKRGELAYATIHLDEGSAGILRDLNSGLVSPMYTVLKVDGEVDPEFLLLVLKHPKSQLVFRGIGQGTVNRRASIGFDALSRLYVYHPPLREQRKIAAAVSFMDQALDMMQSVINGLKSTKDQLTRKLLAEGFAGTENSEWARLPLGTLLSAGPDNGLYFPQSSYGQGTPIVRITDFGNGEDLMDKVLQRVEVPSEAVERFQLRSGDILINRVNSMSHLAKAAFVRETTDTTVFESNMMRVRIDEECAFPRFVFHVLSSPMARQYFRQRAKQAVAQASVNQRDVRELQVPLPPYDVQVKISEVIDSVQGYIKSEAEVLRCFRQLRSTLSTALLTGQIRVTPDEAQP